MSQRLHVESAPATGEGF